MQKVHHSILNHSATAETLFCFLLRWGIPNHLGVTICHADIRLCFLFNQWGSTITVGLNMYETPKRMLAKAKHTFEYFWVYHESKFFCNRLATRWSHHHFCWKLEFWAKIFLVNSFRKKNDFKVVLDLFFVHNWI